MDTNMPPRLDMGIHPDVPDLVYHADPAIETSASASILRELYDRSPLHAFTAHPRLNPAVDRGETTDAMATGTILHALILGGPSPHRVLNFDSYRTDAAKKARAQAVEDGLVPILAHKMDDLYPVADALRATLAHDHPEIWAALTDAETLREATLIWREDGTMCRCRFDALPPPRYGATYDLKFTGLSAEPDEWSRKLLNDYLFQASFYPRAVKALRGDEPEFRFICCETSPPYGVSIHAAAPDVQEIGARRVDRALAMWRECLRTGKWPGYTPLVHYATAPVWFEKKEEDRLLRDKFAARALPSEIAAVHRIAAELGGPLR